MDTDLQPLINNKIIITLLLQVEGPAWPEGQGREDRHGLAAAHQQQEQTEKKEQRDGSGKQDFNVKGSKKHV